MTSIEVASEVASAVASVPEFQAALETGQVLLRGILDKATYIEARLDESQGKSSDLFRHIQQSLEEFDAQLGGAVQFEKNLYFFFKSFSKNRLLQGLSGVEKLQEFKILVKAAQIESFEGVCWSRFQHLLEIRMLEMKLEANFEDGLEDALKLKKKEYKEYLETAKSS